MKHDLRIGNFLGTFSADTIPEEKAVRRPCTFICNTSAASQKGEHFVTIACSKNYVHVFDSLALPLEVAAPALWLNLKQLGKRRIKLCLDAPLQSSDSIFCGYYCAFFVCYLSRHQFRTSLIRCLKPLHYYAFKANDKIVVHNIGCFIKDATAS